MSKRLRLTAALATAASVAVLGACAPEPEAQLVEIAASDYAFSIPSTINGGMTRLALTNNGQEPHHAQLIRLNDGVTQEALMGAIAQAGNPGPVFEMAKLAGGPAAVAADGESEAIVDLKPGNYMLLCFIEGPDGLPHIAKGMVQGFEVGAEPEDDAAPPEADHTVTLADFKFEGAPDTVQAGESTWKVINDGPEPHEMAVIKLDFPASEFEGVLGAFASGEAPEGPPPFEDVGGFQGILPNDEGYAVLNLDEGDYALICFIPSPANQGAPHAFLGMWKTFTVE